MDEADLWLEIRKEALEVLHEWDLAKYPMKIPSGIIGRVSNRIRAWYREIEKEERAAVESQREGITIEDEEDFSLPDPASPAGWIIEAKEILEDLAALRVISETDKFILLGTARYGRPMEALSRELKGLSYSGIRQRKSRATRILKAYLTRQARLLAKRCASGQDKFDHGFLTLQGRTEKIDRLGQNRLRGQKPSGEFLKEPHTALMARFTPIQKRHQRSRVQKGPTHVF